MEDNLDDSSTRASNDPARRQLTWRRLAFLGGIATTVAFGTVSAAIGDMEGIAVTAAFGLATGLTRVRKGMIGAVGLVVVSAISLFFMLTAAVTNIRAGSEMGAVLISSGLASLSLLSLTSALAFLARRGSLSVRGPRVALTLTASLLAVLVVWGALNPSVDTDPSDIHLVSENVAFSETLVFATEGTVTVTLENRDLFWHTFTIEDLDVDLRVPVGAELAVAFEAPPGEYRFVCDIPGHPEAGMVGTLRVEG